MESTIAFLVRHGYVLLLAWVFAEQLGVPIPSIPVLLAAGALVGDGRMSLAGSLLCCLVAALAADLIWFELGRLKGIQVLRLLCRMSLEPDSCVRTTEGLFSRRGARTLVLSKFFPGLNTVSPPLAGVVGMSRGRFLFFDALGALIWAGTFLGLGYAFSGEIERLAAHAERLGGWSLAIAGFALGLYVAYKFVARQRFLHELRIARIGVDDLKARLDAGEPVFIVDLRHAIDVAADPETIPGAFRMDTDEIEHMHGRLPRDREVILFCT